MFKKTLVALLDATHLHVDHEALRELGYVIVPIQPSEATIKAMAGCIYVESDHHCGEAERNIFSARAAYAAVTDTARLTEGKAG